MREEFFSTKLIQWLWQFCFIQMKPQLFINHLRRVRSYPFEGEARFRALMIDIKHLEIKYKSDILPLQCLNSANIKLFTRFEAEKELEINLGRHNSKQSATLQKWFQQNKDFIPSNMPLIRSNDLNFYTNSQRPFIKWDDPQVLQTYEMFQKQLDQITEYDRRLKMAVNEDPNFLNNKPTSILGKRDDFDESFDSNGDFVQEHKRKKTGMAEYILEKCKLNRNYLNGI